jgi:hypothetical protein
MILLLVALALDLESGPRPGEVVPALKATAVIGGEEGKESDFAKDRGAEPTVYLFVASDKFSRPMFRFMKTLDEKLAESGGDKAKAVGVWVGDDVEKDKAFLERARGSLKFEQATLTVFTGGKAGPDGWALNPDAHLTVVVAGKGTVSKSFAFDTVNETDARKVLAELKKVAGK